MEKRRSIDIVIGNKMSMLRKKANLTQNDICSVIGVNASTYRHYELGDRMAPISILQYLAKLYKVSINYFFEDMTELCNEELMKTCTLKYDSNMATKLKVEDENKTQNRVRLRIRNMRLENNKSQKDIAEYLEIDLSTYNKYEKGSRKLSNEIVKKISEYYNVFVSDIVD